MAGEWRRKDPGDTLVEPPMWEASPQKARLQEEVRFDLKKSLKSFQILSNSS